jgi:glucose/arabinose dehydrogenase
MRFPFFFIPPLSAGIVFINSIAANVESARADDGNADRGKVYFQQSCAICHADALGAGNAEIVKQGPSLVGVFGRRAAATASFTYSKALTDSGLTWDAPTLDRYLASPSTVVPGTMMPANISAAGDRADVIAYLATLHVSSNAASAAPATPSPSAPGSGASTEGDWENAAPGVKHHITVADLPAPFATRSAGNGPKNVKQPDGAAPSVPEGFQVKLFASNLSNPRLLRVAPNGDIFVAETGAKRIRVLRAAGGAEAPSQNEIFADGLDRPFGIAFYPAGDHPQWVYVANNNSVVRFPYHSGDLKASGPAEVVVPHLEDSGGGHSTRDIAFSKDGKRLFISVGSGSNVAEHLTKKSPEEIKAWEAEHGRGADWDGETNRADILVTDPEGHAPLHTFATGIRNGVGIAVNEETGDLWVSTNERDGLGDDLVPDYISRVKEGGFYGWPWYYLGNHEDPRHAGERPDLANVAIVPDVLLQAHSASLEMTFYTAKKGAAVFPAEYRGDAFAAEHGSWNRTSRTGYKVIRVRLNHGVPTGEYDDFLTGFVVDEKTVWGRPVGVAVAHDGALLVTEDANNTIWRVSPVGK